MLLCNFISNCLGSSLINCLATRTATFPWKFFKVVSSAFQWSYVANLKEFIFAIFALSSMFTWTCLWAYEKILGKQDYITALDNIAEFVKKQEDQVADTMELQQLVVEGAKELAKTRSIHPV